MDMDLRMSNILKHFGFNKHSSFHNGRLVPPTASSGILPPDKKFNKNAFVNDVFSCMDLCSSYIQALNALCGAGTVLAQSLLQVFQDSPLYHEISSDFFDAWNEVSRATAGASAAVKTETLMTVQEALNKLESEESNKDDSPVVTESVKAVATCLLSYIELQAQFSQSAWRSMSHLSKNLHCDSSLLGAQSSSSYCGLDSGGAVARNPDIITTIRNQFSHVLQQYSSKAPDNPPPFQDDIYKQIKDMDSLTSPREQVRMPFASRKSDPCLSSYSMSMPVDEAKSKKGMQDTPSELEDVINLLSCQPKSNAGKSTFNAPISSKLFSNQILSSSPSPWPPPNVDAPPTCLADYSSFCPGAYPGNLYDGKRTWPRVNSSSPPLGMGMDSWIWSSPNSRTVDIEEKSSSVNPEKDVQGSWGCISRDRWSGGTGENSSSSEDTSSISGQDKDVFSLGLDFVGRDLVNSIRQRRCSSSEGVQDSVPEPSAIRPSDISWEVRATKTSTWPLKQSGPRVLDSSLLPPSAYSPANIVGAWGAGTASAEDKGGKKYSLFGQPSIMQ